MLSAIKRMILHHPTPHAQPARTVTAMNPALLLDARCLRQSMMGRGLALNFTSGTFIKMTFPLLFHFWYWHMTGSLSMRLLTLFV